MTFQDLFKKSALELFPNQIEPLTLILTLVIAFLVGMGILRSTAAVLSVWCMTMPSTFHWSS